MREVLLWFRRFYYRGHDAVTFALCRSFLTTEDAKNRRFIAKELTGDGREWETMNRGCNAPPVLAVIQDGTWVTATHRHLAGRDSLAAVSVAFFLLGK
jgi:hypothetical protein